MKCNFAVGGTGEAFPCLLKSHLRSIYLFQGRQALLISPSSPGLGWCMRRVKVSGASEYGAGPHPPVLGWGRTAAWRLQCSLSLLLRSHRVL